MVNGIVAARNGIPYVQIATENAMLGQLTVSEARSIANDLYLAASRAEADAMIAGFFQALNIPKAALADLLLNFRDFRHELDMEKAEKSQSNPDTGEKL